MSEEPIPVAVVGTGNMGSNHVRVYDGLPGADLVEIVEPDTERAAELSAEYDVTVQESVEDLQHARAATVSVPNDHHRPVTEQLLASGLDVLVEKPLATSVTDAQAIVDAADRADAVLQVGHIERYNPVVETLSDILDSERLIALDVDRLGPFNQHLTAESVVFDLMIHDIDVVDSLVDGGITHLDAVGVTPRSELVDHAVATLKYGEGTLCSLTASHVTHGKIRTLTATTENAYIELDYRAQTLSIQRHGIEETTPFSDRVGYRAETIVERPFVRTREPLQNELESFLHSVRTRQSPRVDGQQGVRAVELATEVVDAIDSA